MKVALFFASHHGKLVGVDDERLTIVLGHDVEDYSRYEQQDSRDNEHNCSDECGEARHDNARILAHFRIPALT